jgi:hypothetical protein
MIVAVQGSNDFDDYQIFLRAMGVAMSSMKKDDNEFILYSVGPARVNSMVSEFSNLSERGMKARGIKIKFFKAPVSWMIENMEYTDYFAYLGTTKHQTSKMIEVAEQSNVEVGIFRY